MSVQTEDKYRKNRRRLYKVLGKEVEFSATKGKISFATKKSCCLINVKYKGKVVADHVWVNNTKCLQQHRKGTELHFNGTANTYKDKKGNRKLGIGNCHGFHVRHPGIEQYLHDKENAMKRLRA